MLIRPADLGAPLTSLTGVAGSNKSMERDARERYIPNRRQSAPEDNSENENETAPDPTEDHMIDETA